MFTDLISAVTVTDVVAGIVAIGGVIALAKVATMGVRRLLAIIK